MKVLVTGGAGYIGSHFVKLLAEKDYDFVVVDNFSRGHLDALPPHTKYYSVDINDAEELNRVFKRHHFDAVVHFAAFAYVGESTQDPEMYYTNNVAGSLNLIKATAYHDVGSFIFSSTCSVYGNPLQIPITEEETIKPINPYANTKFIIETILKDFDMAYGLKYAALRYFNAAGAHSSGTIGESHIPEPHLIPNVLLNALGQIDKISVFGNDYPTPDGTCIRDYIHVDDLAEAHLKALHFLVEGRKSDFFNLGTGVGNSVLEIIQKASEITGRQINFEIAPRRAGDPAVLIADSRKAAEILNWSPARTIDDIIESAWRWHQNPKY